MLSRALITSQRADSVPVKVTSFRNNIVEVLPLQWHTNYINFTISPGLLRPWVVLTMISGDRLTSYLVLLEWNIFTFLVSHLSHAAHYKDIIGALMLRVMLQWEINRHVLKNNLAICGQKTVKTWINRQCWRLRGSQSFIWKKVKCCKWSFCG